MTKIYISGGITGRKNYLEQFNNAEKKFNKEYEVFNPAKIDFYYRNDNFHAWWLRNKEYMSKKEIWCHYMRICIPELLKCKKIYMLKFWWLSKGAVIEYIIAKIMGLDIIYEI